MSDEPGARATTNQGPTSRRVTQGGSWMLGGSILAACLQIPYAAASSRIASPDAFGGYSAALSGMGLIGLVLANGLGPIGARESDPSPRLFRQLHGTAWLLGAVSAVLAIVLAGPWAKIWSAPSAAASLRWGALLLVVSPLQSLLVGETRREGRFRLLATTTVASWVVGIGVGLAVVTRFQTSASLLGMTITTSWVQVLVLLAALDRPLLPARPGREMAPRLRFFGKFSGISAVQYLYVTAPSLTIGRAIGSASLGQFNRASTFTALPFYMVQTATREAVYPEFRHDIGHARRSWSLWPKLLTLSMWAAAPAGAVGGLLVAALIPPVLGERWATASAMALPLALSAALNVPASLLSGALEATGRFRHLSASLAPSLAVVAAGCLLGARTGSWAPVVWAMVLQTVVGHATLVVVAGRARLSDPWATLRGYARAVAFALVAALWCQGLVIAVRSQHLGAAAMLATLGVLAGGLIARYRSRLEPYRIAVEYGLISPRR